MRVAWIGLGAMGSRMASRLARAGHVVVAWNRTGARAEELGVDVAASPREAAAAAEVAFTMVADPDALRAVTEGADGVLAGLCPGVTLVEMSTVGPEAVRRLAAALPEGRRMVDVPVLGSRAEAESGTLTLFAGGDAETLEPLLPLLRVLGEPLHVGPLGCGAAAKLVANASLLGVVALLGETLALADALGLPRERAFELLAVTPLAAQAERRREAVESGEFPPRFPVRLARKDAELIREAAADRELPLLEAARHWFEAAEEAGLGEADYAAVLARIASGNDAAGSS
ncbi:MAG TPA: NAD(P)-dependent oxidoreductase [Gaiellaceae bacterium]|nr:NAD(P)-dependent oxidoreductase [Gaiellaceae bacterium]